MSRRDIEFSQFIADALVASENALHQKRESLGFFVGRSLAP